MSELKSALYLSAGLPYSIADFYKTLDELNQAEIHTVHVDRTHRVFQTEEVVVYFRAVGQNIDGFQVDELFGCYDPKWDLCHLKDQHTNRFSGTIVEYIKKLKENTETDRFLMSELSRIRGGT